MVGRAARCAGRRGHDPGPSCVTWGYRPCNHGRGSVPPCRLRTWESARTCLGGTPAADEPGKKLCGDIPPQAGGTPSYVRTWVGFIYLATVLDCCTKKVVGLRGGRAMRTRRWCAGPLAWRSGGAWLKRM